MVMIEITGNGSDLLGRRQPRKEFANEDFPVPEAPKTTILVKSFKFYLVLDLDFNFSIEEELLRVTGIDYPSRENTWKARYTKRIYALCNQLL